MTWLVTNNRKDYALDFREQLKQQEIIKIPGTHDAMSGIIAKEVGFDAIYLSGGAFSASLGYPDLGIITLTELVTRAREVIRSANLPLLVDIDTGFGSVLNVSRTVKEMADAGVAAIQM